MFKTFYILTGILFCHLALADESAIITLAPFTKHNVNGIDKLQAMNGLAVNGESRMEHVNETRELNPGTFKLFLYVKALDMHWKIVKKQFKTRKGWEDIMSKWRKIDFDQVVPKVFDRSLSINTKTGKRMIEKRYSPQFWQLEQLQAWNARRNIVIYFKSPHPMTEADFLPYAKYFRASIRELKKRFPDLGPLYIMIFNEPDYEYPRHWEKRSAVESISFFYKFYNYIDASIKGEFPDVTLIGPGISRFMDWRNWKLWTVPFLRDAPQADFFNCQPYCRRFTDLLAWTEMLQAESLKLNRKRVPMVMTETNMGGMRSPAAEWWKEKYHVQRVFDEARGMFGCLNNPDMFSMKHFFIYSYHHKFADMWYERNGVENKTPVYWLYWLFRDVSGDKCFSTVNRETSPLKVVAARDGQTVTLAVFNQSAQPAGATLQTLWPNGIIAPPCVIEYLRYDQGSKKFIHGVEPKQHFPQKLLLAPGEIKKLRWVYSPTRKITPDVVKEKAFYSTDTAMVVKDTPRRTAIAAVRPQKDETVRLRLSFYLDDLLAVDAINWTFNKHPLSVSYAPAEYDKGRVSPIIHVNSIIPAAWIKKQNELEFSPVNDCSYRVMSSSLVISVLPDGFPAYVPSNAIFKKTEPITMTINLPRFIEPGRHDLKLMVTNHTDVARKGMITLSLPESWRLLKAPDAFSLSPKEAKEVSAQIEVPTGDMRSNNFVTATLTSSGLRDFTVKRGTAYQVPFRAEFATTAPVIDGKLSEWNPRSFIREKHYGPGVKLPFSSSFAARWDENNLYVALKVSGRKLNALPAGEDYWWKYDTLELFLDFPNNKKTERDEQTVQAWVVLKNLANNQTKWGLVPTDPNGCILKKTPPQSFKGQVIETSDGFILEAALDWQSLSTGWSGITKAFRPKAGMTLGCEATLAGRSLIGSFEKAYSCPAKWGNLTLLGKNQKVERQTQTIKLDTSINKQPAKKKNTDKPVLFKFNAFNKNNWKFPSRAVCDAAGLHLPNNHASLVLTKPLVNTLSGKGTTFKVTLGGFEKTGTSDENLKTDARIFVSPAQEKSTEPYVMKDMICLLVHYEEKKDVSVTLYRKAAPEKNWGKMLWSGTFPEDQFPVTLSLTLNRENFKIRSDKDLTPSKGSLSGKHHLPEKLWSGNLRFGLKSCFGRNGAVIIRNIDIIDNK